MSQDALTPTSIISEAAKLSESPLESMKKSKQWLSKPEAKVKESSDNSKKTMPTETDTEKPEPKAKASVSCVSNDTNIVGLDNESSEIVKEDKPKAVYFKRHGKVRITARRFERS